jgi:hypothetical protein
MVFKVLTIPQVVTRFYLTSQTRRLQHPGTKAAFGKSIAIMPRKRHLSSSVRWLQFSPMAIPD